MRKIKEISVAPHTYDIDERINEFFEQAAELGYEIIETHFVSTNQYAAGYTVFIEYETQP